MNSIREAGNWISSSTKGHSAAASKEVNKSVAKDPNAGIGTRLRAAKNAIGDSMHEASHKREADVHKHAAKHNY